LPASSLDNLPIAQHFSDVERFLSSTHLVIEAPPGAGKSTALPLFLLRTGFARKGRIVMLQPRRLAAVNIANFLAQQLGEPVGKRVGFHIRQEKQYSEETELLIVTEGIFTRMLQGDPELQGVGLVLFDEFHERNLHSDLGLALTLEALELRSDLRLVIMSATLPGAELSDWLVKRGCDNRLLVSEGRRFPIDDHYRPPAQLANWLTHLPAVIREAISVARRGVLVFLPGVREIKRLQAHFNDMPEIDLQTLYGGLSLKAQAYALAPSDHGKIKVVLSTNLAETSLTIEGIDVVVDSGRVRVAKYHPQYRMTRLLTQMISKASAEQRRGRAGRTAAGTCFRIWPQAQQERLQAYDLPAVETEDLTSIVLECCAWGARPEELAWFSQPSQTLLEVAYETLSSLQLITQKVTSDRWQLTSRGEWVQAHGIDPRMGACLWALKDQPEHFAAMAWFIAVTEMREVRSSTPELLEMLASSWQQRNQFPRTLRRYRAILKNELGTQNKVHPHWQTQETLVNALLQGFPDRVAHLQGERAVLTTGVAAIPRNRLKPGFGIALEITLSDTKATAVLEQWLSVSLSTLLTRGSALLTAREEASWRGNTGGLANERVTYWGKLELKRELSQTPVSTEHRALAFAKLIKEQGWQATGYSERTEKLLARLAVASQVLLENGKDTLFPFPLNQCIENIEHWGLMWLQPLKTVGELAKWEPEIALWQGLSYAQQQEVDRITPRTWRAPSGLEHDIDYRDQAGPKVALKLQEVFGLPVSPKLPSGHPIILELLSPAKRPLHRTSDLASFWQNAWPSVKKEMRGKYPKHPWPDDPINAVASHLTKRALEKKDSSS